MTRDYQLCRLDDIPENGAKGFTVMLHGSPLRVFIVRKGGVLYGYVNQCPHTGVNLDWTPDQFLDLTGRLIQCATHGALFQIEDGRCIDGPCVGDALISIKTEIDNGDIRITIPASIL